MSRATDAAVPAPPARAPRAGAPELVVLANARLPSQRAQSLQVVQVAASFARAGAHAELWHARRVPTPPLPAGVDLFDHYGAAAGPRPVVRAVPCVDWIDRVPRRAQFVPARVQEWTFSRNAAARVARTAPQAIVLSRELEAARALALRRGAARHFAGRVFWEVHRVPGGRLRSRWLAEALPMLDGLIAISGGVADDLVARGADPARITVEHDGYEAARFASLPTRAEARARLGLAADARVVVYTGSLLEWKGVDVLVEAARELADATIVIAGGPDVDAAALRERARSIPHVRVDGYVAPARVLDYLAAADVGVVPNRSRPAISARYTSPLKVFEAMAAGLPLVASDLPSLRELLTDGEDAILVAPDDPAALAGGLRRVLDDAALRGRLAAALAARAPAHTWDARACRLLRWMGLVPDGDPA